MTTGQVRRWQTVERKARFIAQIKTGDLDARTVDDIGSDDLGNAAAATKAVATGDPRHLVQVALDDDVTRLGALKRAHGDAQWRHRDEQKQYSKEVTASTAQLEAVDAALPAIRASANDPFAMSIAGRRYTERADAAPALLHAARGAYTHALQHGASRSFPVAQLRGVEVRATRFLTTDDVMFALSNSAPPKTRCAARWPRTRAGWGGTRNNPSSLLRPPTPPPSGPERRHRKATLGPPSARRDSRRCRTRAASANNSPTAGAPPKTPTRHPGTTGLPPAATTTEAGEAASVYAASGAEG